MQLGADGGEMGGAAGGGVGGAGGGASISTIAILDEASTRALCAHTRTRLAAQAHTLMAVARSDGSLEIHTIPEPDADPFGGGESATA